MSVESYEFERFSSRDGFNKSLLHFQSISSMLGDFESHTNLADILNELLSEKEMTQNQIGPTIYALLVDKYGYKYESFNVERTISDFEGIATECAKWKAVDVVLAYHHPELGLLVINPKDLEQLQGAQAFKRNELLTIYVGAFGHGELDKAGDDAIKAFGQLLSGKKAAAAKALYSGKFPTKAKPKPKPSPKPKPAAKKTAAASSGKAAAPAAPPKAQAAAAPAEASKNRRMTPMYSVPVVNELFHNGNVEAWKKIIQSYQTKYPGLDVYIFYDGERIHDINTLFKWGKVKHGSTILFSVAGETIKDVAKLQRYLRQGASPRFEDFLRFPVNTVLKLF